MEKKIVCQMLLSLKRVIHGSITITFLGYHSLL